MMSLTRIHWIFGLVLLVAEARLAPGQTTDTLPTTSGTLTTTLPETVVPILLTTSSATTAPVPAAMPAPAPEPPSIFHLDFYPTQTTIGEPVGVTLRSDRADITPDRISAVTSELDPQQWHLERDWRRDWDEKQRRETGPWRAVVRPFEPGQLTFPPVTVAWSDGTSTAAQQAVTTSATLDVLSVRPANATTLKLLPMRDPAALPRDWSWLYLLIGLALLACALAWIIAHWLRGRTRPAVVEPPAPELPPGLWALQELDRRSRLPVANTGPAKAVYTLISEVVRIYFGRRYRIDAIDMTTLECMRALQGIGLEAGILRWAQDFLDECDVVKFTRHEPPRERWATVWDNARLIVKMTTPPEELGIFAPPEPAIREAVP